MNREQATVKVVRAIEACTEAKVCRQRAADAIRSAAMTPGADLPSAEHAVTWAAAEAAVYVLEAEPDLIEVVTVADLANYVLHQAVVLALGWDGRPVELELRQRPN